MINTVIITITIAILLLISAWNGYVIRWALASDQNREKYNSIWHDIGLIVRILIAINLFLILFPDMMLILKSLLLVIPCSHLFYNVIINLIRNRKWYYLSDSGIDKFIGKTNLYPVIISAEIIMIITAIVL